MNKGFIIRPIESQCQRQASDRQDRYRPQGKAERAVEHEANPGPAGQVDELLEGKRPENFILYL